MPPRVTLNDFSETPVENGDIGGVPILGSNKPSNLDDAERATVAILAKAVNGTTPVNDTWTWRDKDSPSKEFRFDAGNLSGSVDIDAKALSDLAEDAPGIISGIARRGAPTKTPYIASGTHTFAVGTAYFQIVAVGSGGGSGNVDGQDTGTGGATAGANSGFFGESPIYAKGALVSGAVVIGAAGIAGAGASGNGGDGGDVTWTDTEVGTLTWKGGKGSVGVVATAARAFGLPLANAASSAALIGANGIGGMGNTNGISVAGGLGGSSPWGTGGISTVAFGAVVNGVAGTGYGSGASGSGSQGVPGNAGGVAGNAGRLEVWEW